MSRTSEEAKELIRWALQTNNRIITILSSDDHYIVIKWSARQLIRWLPQTQNCNNLTLVIATNIRMSYDDHLISIWWSSQCHHDPSWPHLIKSRRLLLVEPSERMSASECLQHPWLSGADIYIGDPVEAFRGELYKYILLDIHRWCWRSFWSIIGTYVLRIFYENL